MAIDIPLDKLIPPPDPTSSEPWEVSIAELVRKTRKVPKLAVKPLDLLDRFGSVRITPDEIGFDNDNVEWGKVVELRTHLISNLLTGKALENEVDRIRNYLPPIPGRKWVVNKVVNLMLDLTLALSGDDLAQKVASGIDSFGVDSDDPNAGRVVAEIVYKGRFGRTKDVQCGLFAAAVLAAQRGVTDALCQGAGMRGIPVVASADEEHFSDALERSEKMRTRIDKLRATAQRLRGKQDDEDDDEDEPAVEAGGAVTSAGEAAGTVPAP